MVELSLARIDEQPLEDETKKSHKKKLNYLQKVLDADLEWILLNPKKSIKVMKEHISEKSATLVGYCTAVCSLYTMHPTFLKEHQDEYKEWSKYLKQYNKQKRDEYEEMNMNENQNKAVITYDEVKAKFCEMAHDPETSTDMKANLQYVLLGMFLSIKPKRADLGDVYVSLSGKIPKSYTSKNFILLENDTDAKLVLNQYKTKKIYGTLVESLPPEIAKVIRQSIELFPRKHLFVGLIGDGKGKPYSNNSYSQFVIRTCEALFGRKMGVAGWRHVFIGQHVDFNYGDRKAMAEAARLSGHSVPMQHMIYNPSHLKLEKRSQEEINAPIQCSA